MKYSFNHAGPYVEIVDLDMFLHELRKVCKMFSIGFRLASFGKEDPYDRLVIVPFTECDWDIFTDSLSEYDHGVPFLDEAKLRWRAALEKLAEEAEQRRQTQMKKANYLADARKERQEADMRRNGIILSDGVYKLVKE